MLIILGILIWLFFGLLGLGIYRRTGPKIKTKRSTALHIICLGVIAFITSVIFWLIEIFTSDWWDEEI